MVSGQGSSVFISSFRGAIVCAGEDNSLRVFDLGSEHRLPHLLFATAIAVPSDAVLCGGCCSNDIVVLQDSAGNLYAVDIQALPTKPFEQLQMVKLTFQWLAGLPVGKRRDWPRAPPTSPPKQSQVKRLQPPEPSSAVKCTR